MGGQRGTSGSRKCNLILNVLLCSLRETKLCFFTVSSGRGAEGANLTLCCFSSSDITSVNLQHMKKRKLGDLFSQLPLDI